MTIISDITLKIKDDKDIIITVPTENITLMPQSWENDSNCQEIVVNIKNGVSYIISPDDVLIKKVQENIHKFSLHIESKEKLENDLIITAKLYAKVK